MPEFISEIVGVVDASSKIELMSWTGFDVLGKWDEDYYNENKHDLLVYIAAEFFEMSNFVQKEGYVQYDDYLMYIFFFMQYRKITGKNLKRDMKFVDILSEYRKIDDETLWKKFVYSDDPEGDRIYNLFLYDDFDVDFYEEINCLNYIDEEIAERSSKLMHNQFCDDSISHIRKFNLVKYLNPDYADYLESMGVGYFAEGEGVFTPPTLCDYAEDDTDEPPFGGDDDTTGKLVLEDEDYDAFMKIPEEIDDFLLPFDAEIFDDIQIDWPEVPQRIRTAKEIVEEYVSNRISGLTYYCVGKLYKNTNDEDNKKAIEKLESDIQNLYGEVKWFDVEKKQWIKANVPEYLTREEFQNYVDENKKSHNMIAIYNYLFSVGQREYFIHLVEYLKKVFCFVYDDEVVAAETEDIAVNDLFCLTNKINVFFNPVFKVIAREKERLNLVSIKDPYNFRHQLDASEELRLQMGLPSSDAWLLQEQIYL